MKFLAIENSEGTITWAARGDANGMKDRIGMVPAD
jgi:ABC-type uncharacterized transport system ATPase subunit